MKRSIVLSLCLIMIFLFCGCSSDINVNTKALENDIINKIQFSTNLKKLSLKKACSSYDVDINLIKTGVAYISEDKNMDELSIWETIKPDDAPLIKERIEQRIRNLIDNVDDDKGKKFKKISNAVLFQKGAYVVFCLSDNSDQVRKLIKAYSK